MRSLNATSMIVGVTGGGPIGCGIAAKLAVAGVETLVYPNTPGARERIYLPIAPSLMNCLLAAQLGGHKLQRPTLA